MQRLKIEDLYRIKEETLRGSVLDEKKKSTRITVHMGTCGISSGADKVYKSLQEEIRENERKDIVLTTSGCAGLCNREPLMTIEKIGQEAVRYAELTPERAVAIFKGHVLKGEINPEWVYARGWEQKKMDFEDLSSSHVQETTHIRDIPFFGKQELRVMRNRGLIQAEKIEEYIATDGYFAANKALCQSLKRSKYQASGVGEAQDSQQA
jgi:NADP-reducing hydrogenase subunit HndB